MAKDQRHKDADWVFPTTDKGAIEEWQYVGIAVMMDVRDELKKLNALLHCHNTVAIPEILRGIKRNTANLPKAKKAGKP